MEKYVCVFLPLFIVGCGADYSGHSIYSPYTGFSSHFKETTGTSNLTYGYKDPPILDANDPLARFEFERSANDYLDGVVNDLKEVNDKAGNATEKIDAVVDAVNSGLEYFHVRYVGSVFILNSESNFDVLGYPEFPDFHRFPPTKPPRPLFLDNELAVEFYNARVRSYNREVADFAATVRAYIEDAEHYIENCKNDYREIRQKGLHLLSYVETLGMDVEAGLVGVSPHGLPPGDMEAQTYTSTQQPTPEPKPKAPIDASPREIQGYKLKTDSAGEPMKDKDGNFVFVPVYEDEQQK